MSRCLNCGADLNGAFCGECGQRSVPADPTIAEIAADAWQELSGYDGRIAATFRALLHPGRLTIDYLQGRRARYLSPVRLYLIVSVVYFVIAASVPRTASDSGEVRYPGGLQIEMNNPGANGAVVSDADRAEMANRLAEAPWYIRPIIKAISEDPAGFQGRLFTIMPRVFFALLPVFAGIVAMFYRRRRFPAALVFAVHVHAFAFVVFSISEAVKLTGSVTADATAGVIVAMTFMAYALTALRAVFGGGWPVTVAKAIGIGFVYLVAAVPAFFVMLVWASLV